MYHDLGWRQSSPRNQSFFYDLASLVASPANKWGAVLLNRSTQEIIGRAAHDGTRWVFGDLDLTKVSTSNSEVPVSASGVSIVSGSASFTYGAGLALAAGVVRLAFMTDSRTQVRVTCAGAVQGNLAGDKIAVGRTLGGSTNYVGQGCQSPGVVKCYVRRDVADVYGTLIPVPSDLSYFGGWIGGATGSLVMAFTSFSQSQAGPAASNILSATPLEFNTTGSAVVVKTIGLL
jgi:hypothetical protein